MNRIQTFKELLKYSAKTGAGYVIIILIKNCFSAILPLLDIFGLGAVIDALTTGKSKEEILRIILIYLGLTFAIMMLQSLFVFLQNRALRKASDKVQYEYIRDGITVDYHWAQDGSILTMKNKSMGAHPAFIFDHIGEFFGYIVKFVGIFYIFSVLSPFFIIIIAVTSFLSVVLTFKGRKITFDHENEKIEENRRLEYLYSLMTKYDYAKEIRINNLKSIVVKKNIIVLTRKMKKIRAYIKKSLKIESLSILVAVVQSFLMYSWFSYSVYKGQISIAEYTMLLGAVSLLTSILISFFDKFSIIDRMLSKMELFLNYKGWIADHNKTYRSNELPKAGIDQKNIVLEFENVSFIYPGTEKSVLNCLNFKIRQGEVVGLVGLNGSGKSTIVKLITRLYTPTSGRILLNGVDIQTIPISEYLKCGGTVLQDFCVFAYSMKENIIFDMPEDAERLNESIERSGLKSKVESLERGVNTMLYKELDENGVEFSGGEGQRLALARALYKDAGLLILDEPTSSLDPVAEYNMYSNMYNLSKGKTTIFISHRLSSTRFCDRILVLKDGMIAEEGTHNELMAARGEYFELFDLQAKFYKGNGVLI